jgi:hypothetical protein
MLHQWPGFHWILIKTDFITWGLVRKWPPISKYCYINALKWAQQALGFNHQLVPKGNIITANVSTRTDCLITFFFLRRYGSNLGPGLPPCKYPFHFGFLDLRQSVGLFGWVISSSQGLYLYTNTEKRTHTSNIHALSWIQTHDPGFRASEGSACLRPLGYRDRLYSIIIKYLTSNELRRWLRIIYLQELGSAQTITGTQLILLGTHDIRSTPVMVCVWLAYKRILQYIAPISS